MSTTQQQKTSSTPSQPQQPKFFPTDQTRPREAVFEYDQSKGFPEQWFTTEGSFDFGLYMNQVREEGKETWIRNNFDLFRDQHLEYKEWPVKTFDQVKDRVKKYASRDLFFAAGTDAEVRWCQFTSSWKSFLKRSGDQEGRKKAQQLRLLYNRDGSSIQQAPPPSPRSENGSSDLEGIALTSDLEGEKARALKKENEDLLKQVRDLQAFQASFQNQQTTATAGPPIAPGILLTQKSAVMLTTLTDGGRNLERFYQSIDNSRGTLTAVNRNDHIDKDLKPLILDSFSSFAATAITTQSKALIEGWQTHENWDDTRFFDVMRAVFNTAGAKACHTAVDYNSYLNNAPSKDFFFGIDYPKLAAILNVLKNAAKNLSVNIPAKEGDEGDHKSYIRKITSRMREAIKNTEDYAFANHCLNKANPASNIECLGEFCANLLISHRQATQVGEQATSFGYVYMPWKDTKDPARKETRPNDSESEAARKRRKLEQREKEKKINPAKAAEKEKTDRSGLICQGCGGPNHSASECGFKDQHPDFNSSSKPWAESEKGKECAKNDMGRLLWYKRADGSAFQKPGHDQRKQQRENRKREHTQKGKGGK